MTYVLGVDGGNTKTIALVARTDGTIIGVGRSCCSDISDGTIIGVGRSRCSDIYGASSPEAAIAEANSAITMALSGAGIQKEALSASCLSMAGADWNDDIEFLQRSFAGYGETLTIGTGAKNSSCRLPRTLRG
jgi:N-acetylglucosamine kinase-like BadF-type ATPase